MVKYKKWIILYIIFNILTNTLVYVALNNKIKALDERIYELEIYNEEGEIFSRTA